VVTTAGSPTAAITDDRRAADGVMLTDNGDVTPILTGALGDREHRSS
jgi:hypothetical protein